MGKRHSCPVERTGLWLCSLTWIKMDNLWVEISGAALCHRSRLVITARNPWQPWWSFTCVNLDAIGGKLLTSMCLGRADEHVVWQPGSRIKSCKHDIAEHLSTETISLFNQPWLPEFILSFVLALSVLLGSSFYDTISRTAQVSVSRFASFGLTFFFLNLFILLGSPYFDFYPTRTSQVCASSPFMMCTGS